MLAPNVRTSNPLATKDEFVGDALDEPEIPFEVPPNAARRLTELGVARSRTLLFLLPGWGPATAMSRPCCLVSRFPTRRCK